jgi:hypothetical protein
MNTAIDEFGSIDVVIPNGSAAAGPKPKFFRDMEAREVHGVLQ